MAIIKRIGMGGVYVNVSPDYQRGLLKGISRTLKANIHDACVVCKVDLKNGYSNERENTYPEKN